MHKKLIIAECYADSVLTRFIISKINMGLINEIEHVYGIGRVSKYIEKNKFLLCITDNDLVKPELFKKFVKVNEECNIIWKNFSTRQSEQDILLLKPDLEFWLLSTAKSVNVKHQEFGIPSKIKELKKITKHKSIEGNENFIKFLNILYEKKAKQLLALENILKISLGVN